MRTSSGANDCLSHHHVGSSLDAEMWGRAPGWESPGAGISAVLCAPPSRFENFQILFDFSSFNWMSERYLLKDSKGQFCTGRLELRNILA